MSPRSALGQKLLTTARVPHRNASQFLATVSASIRAYLQVAKEPSPTDITNEIVNLASEVASALKNPDVQAGIGVANRVAALSPAARDSIE